MQYRLFCTMCSASSQDKLKCCIANITTNAGDRLIPPKMYIKASMTILGAWSGWMTRHYNVRALDLLAILLGRWMLLHWIVEATQYHTIGSHQLVPPKEIDAIDSPRKQSNQVLFFVIFNIQHQILEMVRKPCFDRKCLLRVTYAHTVERQCLALTAGIVEKTSDIWVMWRPCKISNDFEAWNGPNRRPGRISWHSRLISYLTGSRYQECHIGMRIWSELTAIRRLLGLVWCYVILPRCA